MTLPFNPDKFDPAKVAGSTVVIKDITRPGRAVQIIGGVPPPPEPAKVPRHYSVEEIKARYADMALTMYCFLPEIEAADRDRANDLLNQGMDFSDAGKTDDALRCLTEAVAVLAPWVKHEGSPESSLKTGVALFTMGRTLRRAGRLDDATARLQQALSVLEPLQTGSLRSQAQEEIGWVLADQSILSCNQGQFEQAQACAARAVATVESITAPDNPANWQRLLIWVLRCEGKTLERLHRHAEASQRFQRAAELRACLKTTDSLTN